MTSLQVDPSSLAHFNSLRFEHVVRTLEEDKESLDETKIRRLQSLSQRLVSQPEVSQRIDRLQRIREPVVQKTDNKSEPQKTTTAAPISSAPITESVSIANDPPSSSGSTANDMRILLQDQKDLARRDLEEAQADRALLLEGVAEITGILKETIQNISSSVLEQNLQLDSIHVFASDNKEKLADQKKQMNNVTQNMKLSFCFTIGVLLLVVASFIATYALIRLTPSGLTSLTCPAPPRVLHNIPSQVHNVPTQAFTKPEVFIMHNEENIVPDAAAAVHNVQDQQQISEEGAHNVPEVAQSVSIAGEMFTPDQPEEQQQDEVMQESAASSVFAAAEPEGESEPERLRAEASRLAEELLKEQEARLVEQEATATASARLAAQQSEEARIAAEEEERLAEITRLAVAEEEERVAAAAARLAREAELAAELARLAAEEARIVEEEEQKVVQEAVIRAAAAAAAAEAEAAEREAAAAVVEDDRLAAHEVDNDVDEEEQLLQQRVEVVIAAAEEEEARPAEAKASEEEGETISLTEGATEVRESDEAEPEEAEEADARVAAVVDEPAEEPAEEAVSHEEEMAAEVTEEERAALDAEELMTDPVSLVEETLVRVGAAVASEAVTGEEDARLPETREAGFRFVETAAEVPVDVPEPEL